MGVRNDPPSIGDEARRSKGHHRNRGRHQERPCPNPPSAPTGVTVTFKNNGTRRHPDFSMKIKWNGVYTDEMGQKIPGQGVEIDHYEIQWWPTRANGNAIEDEDGHTRVRRAHKKAVKGVKVIDATIVSGTTAEFTTKTAHGFVTSEIVRVQDVKPAAYNGKWTVLSAGLTATKFRADIGASPANLEDEGTVEGQPDPNYNIVTEKVPRPKRWWWVARVRAWDNKNCQSDWSSLTSPVSPQGNVAPPDPTNVRIFNQAVDRVAIDWDDPIEYITVENGTVSASSGTNTLTGTDTDFLKDLAEAAGVGKPGIWIKVGSETKRVTAISSATALTVHSNWSNNYTDQPYMVEDRNSDIRFYQVQLDTATDFDDPYIFDRRHHRSKFSVKIPTADQGNTFYGRVRSVDHEGKHGKWIPATTAGNSSASTTPSGVTIGAGGGGDGTEPKVPQNLSLTFSTAEKGRGQRWRARCKWDEVTQDVSNNDITVDYYIVQFQQSPDGADTSDDPRRAVINAKDDDADTTAHVLFGRIHRFRYYRFRVRARHKHTRGAWSSWTSFLQPSSETPPSPTNVTIHDRSTNRVVIDWDGPTESSDADILSRDIAHFQVALQKDTTTAPSTILSAYKADRFVHKTRHSFRVPNVDQAGHTFYGWARSVDVEGNKSSWIPATYSGNSSPGTPPSGATIGTGDGRTRHVFSVRGTLRTLTETESHDIELDEPMTLIRVRARVKQAPTGSAITAHYFKNGSSLGTLSISAGTKRDADNGLSIAFADEDVFSFDITSVGSTYPGKHLTLIGVFE